MNHSISVTVLSSKVLAGWKIYEQASSAWVATYLSIRSRHSPLWFHSASNKIQTALQTKHSSSPPRLLLPWALRGFWCNFNLFCASNTHGISQISVSYFKAHSLRDLIHTLGTFWWRFPQPLDLALSAEQRNAQCRPNWESLSTFTTLNCWLSANDSFSELVTHVSMWGGNWNLCSNYELFLSQRLQYACA